MKIAFGKLICACLILFSMGCETKSYEELADEDAKAFFSKLDSFEKLSAHLVGLPTNLPEEIEEQNKAKFIKNLQNYFNEQCEDPKDFKLLKTYRKLGDNDQKNLFLEYEFCSSGTVIMSYEVVDEEVILFGIWPMKTEEKPAVLFTDEADW